MTWIGFGVDVFNIVFFTAASWWYFCTPHGRRLWMDNPDRRLADYVRTLPIIALMHAVILGWDLICPPQPYGADLVPVTLFWVMTLRYHIPLYQRRRESRRSNR